MTTEEVKELREFVFKITMLGDAAVGKTSLISRYCEGTFQEDYKPTLGANIIRKDVNLDNLNARVRLIIWDLAGQEKYNVIRSMYFQGVSGCIIVFDITRAATFYSIGTKWLKDFKRYVKKEGAYILIGNKTDLKEQRAVPTEKGKRFAEEINASDFVETSAKLGENIEEAFSLLVHQILKNHGVNV